MNRTKLWAILPIALIAGAFVAAQEVSSSPDFSSINARLSAMENGPVTTYDDTRAKALAAYDAVPFARTKWAGQNLQTNSAGAWVGTVPAGRMVSGLAVSGMVVHTAGQFTVPQVIATGTPATGYTVTVTFAKAKSSVTVPAIVLGAGALNLSLFEAQANTGVVSFDIGFSEPDVVGPAS